VFRAEEIQQGRLLGKGAFGEVRLVITQGQEMAAKMLNRAGVEEEVNVKSLLLKKVRAMAALQHLHIVRLFGVCLHPGMNCILMEHMQRGSLREVLDEQADLPTWRVFTILRQVVAGMVCAHAHPILHRDLKASNILIDHHFRAAVADLGLAVGEDMLSRTTTITGATLAYAAPEVSGYVVGLNMRYNKI
jgi:serine/threonine protein kinase